jgi:hypothetical protein
MGIRAFGSNAVDRENRVDMFGLREDRLAKLRDGAKSKGQPPTLIRCCEVWS